MDFILSCRAGMPAAFFRHLEHSHVSTGGRRACPPYPVVSFALIASLFLCGAASCRAGDAPTTRPTDAGWQPMFDGKTLNNWSSTNFGGEGEVRVENGSIILDMGASLTGINYKGTTPKMNYEVALDAQRVEGTDFFCGLTVPVGDSFATLVVGGWGGALCGISSLDDKDAARNETKTFQHFENGKWYHIRLRVLPDRLQAWIDHDKIVDVVTTGKKISLRAEVMPSRPFGISAYQTTAALKNIAIRKVEEKK